MERGRPCAILTQVLISLGVMSSLRASVPTSHFSPCGSPRASPGSLLPLARARWSAEPGAPAWSIMGGTESSLLDSLPFAGILALGLDRTFHLPTLLSLQVGGSVVPSLEGCCRTCEWTWWGPRGEGLWEGKVPCWGLRGPGPWPGPSDSGSSGVSR